LNLVDFATFGSLWPWPWPWFRVKVIPLCISHRVLRNIHRVGQKMHTHLTLMALITINMW